MTRPINILFAFIVFLGLYSCSVTTNNHARAIVSPTPSSYAWWLRTEFFPVQKQIRGIPVKQLDSSWSLVSELTRDSIPKELLYEKGADIMDNSEVTFSRAGDFNNDGAEDLALIGIYQHKEGNRGSFILILTKDKSGQWQKAFLERLGKPVFAAISRKEPITVWFCLYCNFGVDLLWNKEEGTYLLKSFENDEAD